MSSREPDPFHTPGFRNVDASRHRANLVAYLDAITPQLKQYKHASYEMLELQPGSRVLEVGCGTGDDVRMLASRVMAHGHVIGIDASAFMIHEARARAAATKLPIEFVVADAHNSGLPTGSFDAARVDRCLQHVEFPDVVIAEMRRMVRPGGFVVAAEPDWDTLVVDASDRQFTRFVVQALSERELAHGSIGRQLPSLMLTAGMQDVIIRPMTLFTQSLAIANELLLLGAAARTGRMSDGYEPERLHAWISDLQKRDAEGRFFAALSGFIVRARVASG